MAQVSPGRPRAPRSSDRWGAALAFEAVEREELVEPRGAPIVTAHTENSPKGTTQTNKVLCLDCLLIFIEIHPGVGRPLLWEVLCKCV